MASEFALRSLMQSPESFTLSESALRDTAMKLAERAKFLSQRLERFNAPESQIYLTLRHFLHEMGVAPPNHPTYQAFLNRVRDPAWWRRALRARFRKFEHAQIKAGAVQRKASPYVSARALRRAQRNRRRFEQFVLAMEAINSNTGEVYPLKDFVERSLANPSNRNKAMMARIKGVERYADEKGHVAVLLTITCPSRMHSHFERGGRNPNYDGTTPRQAQKHLSNVWRPAMRKLNREGIPAYGLRVVEPHHDGCPHWHILVFTPPEHKARLLSIMRDYALRDNPNEPGAATSRFDFKEVEPGGAVGYVAKYVSKNLDGQGIELDEEADIASEDGAFRAGAWASLWGIRQFQFFGVPSVTPARELYRLDYLPDFGDGLRAAFEAVKANDFGAFMAAIELHRLRMKLHYSEHPSARYPGETSHRLEGVIANGRDIARPVTFITRQHNWFIQRRGAGAPGADASLGLDSITARPLISKDFFQDHQTRPCSRAEGRTGHAAQNHPPPMADVDGRPSTSRSCKEFAHV